MRPAAACLPGPKLGFRAKRVKRGQAVYYLAGPDATPRPVTVAHSGHKFVRVAQLPGFAFDAHSLIGAAVAGRLFVTLADAEDWR